MADLLIAGTGGPGKSAAIMARASERWSRIAFLTVVGRAESHATARPARADRNAGFGTVDLGHGVANGAFATGNGGSEATGLEGVDGDERCGDWSILGSTRRARDFRGAFSDLFVAEPRNTARAETLTHMAKLGFFLPCLVHPSASVCRSTSLDYGCLISPQATVEADSRLGMGTIIGPAATVGYECAFGLAVQVAAGAHLGAGVRVGGYSRIGIGAVVAEGVTIGDDVTVVAGAVVTQDIRDGVTVSGSPAAILPEVCPSESGAIRIRL